jgi:CDP-diacylglycerol pyrophosphatase
MMEVSLAKWIDVNVKLRSILLTGIAAAAALAMVSPALGRGSHGSKPSSSDSSSTTTSTDLLQLPTGPDALRQIVQNQCVVDWQQHHLPAPCERVFLADPKNSDSGYAVLADRSGGAHYLLIPTQTMGGTDASELLDPDLPNYFAEAWRARDLITNFVGHEVPRTAIGLAVNAAHLRSQRQFHVHIECLRQEVADSLRASAERVTDVWSPISVSGSTYDGLRISAEGLDATNLFETLATLKPDTRHHMGDYTLVVAGMQFKSGPGFIVLTGTGPSGELLLDSTCAVAGGGG